jgi:hypothetical protein
MTWSNLSFTLRQRSSPADTAVVSSMGLQVTQLTALV